MEVHIVFPSVARIALNATRKVANFLRGGTFMQELEKRLKYENSQINSVLLCRSKSNLITYSALNLVVHKIVKILQMFNLSRWNLKKGML